MWTVVGILTCFPLQASQHPSALSSLPLLLAARQRDAGRTKEHQTACSGSTEVGRNIHCLAAASGATADDKQSPMQPVWDVLRGRGGR